MAIRKRNEYLEAEFSESEIASSDDYEAAADSRTKGLSSRTKRRKLSASASDDGDSHSEQDRKSANTLEDFPTEPASSRSIISPLHSSPPPPTKSSKHPLLTSKSPTKTSRQPGVIYLSRIPPFMRPSTVRHLLTPYGAITHLFLTPEAPSTHALRKSHHGNKKRSYIDGWVEFSRKSQAKLCAEAINGNIVGGKKGGWYRDDVWNAKYLRGFGWEDLMAGVAREGREREERIRVGVAREGRERRAFLKGVEGGKVEETRRRKREAREEKRMGGGDGNAGKDDMGGKAEVKNKEGGEGKRKGFESRFRQNEVTGKLAKKPEQSDEVKRVLSKIF